MGVIRFRGPMDPVFPCRVMPTRHCPAMYAEVCGDRPCARFESEDDGPWLAEQEWPVVVEEG